MKLDVTLEDGRTGLLTDEHSRSSYGLPVLLIDGIAYGPGDSRYYEVPACAPAILHRTVLISDLRVRSNEPLPADFDPYSDSTSGNREIYLWNRALPAEIDETETGELDV